MKLIPVPTLQDYYYNVWHAVFGLPNAEGIYTCSANILALASQYLDIKWAVQGQLQLGTICTKSIPQTQPLSLEKYLALLCQKPIVCFTSRQAIEQFDHTTYSHQTAYIYYNSTEGCWAVDYQSEPLPLRLLSTMEHAASGLKNTLHGNIYQLKLLMLFLHRSYQEKYTFYLATEMDAAGKFDDVVLKYKVKDDDPVFTYRYLQAKHKQEEIGKKERISLTDLLPTQGTGTEKKGKYSLIKYFNSYLKIKQHPDFSVGHLGEFCICTNIGFDDSLMGYFEEVSAADPILLGDRTPRKAKKYRFKKELVLGENRVLLNDVNYVSLYERLKSGNEMLHWAQALDAQLSAWRMQNLPGGTSPFKLSFIHSPLKGNKPWFIENKIICSDNTLTSEFWQGANSLPEPARELHQLWQASTQKNLDTEINDFLDKLVFAVNQPNELELDELLQPELSQAFNFIDNEFVYALFQAEMLKWMKEKKGTMLDQYSIESFLSHINQQLANFALIGPTAIYQKKLADYHFTFESSPRLSTFLPSTNPSRLTIYHAQAGDLRLISVRVYQTLVALGYQAQDAYTLLTLKNALCLGEKFKHSLSSTQLLILICDHSIQEAAGKDLIRTLYANTSPHKVILVTHRISDLKDLGLSIDEINEDINLSALDQVSQSKLYDYPVLLQQASSTIGKLIKDLTPLMDTDILLAIGSKPLSIGQPLEATPSFYMSRKIKRPTSINYTCLAQNISDIFLINGLTKSALEKMAFKDINAPHAADFRYILLEEQENIDTVFENLCRQYPDRPIHYLHWQNGQLLWQCRSHGPLTNLYQYIEYDDQQTELEGKYVVLAADPGMGKSTFITYWAEQIKKRDSLCWVIVVRLLDIEERLKKLVVDDPESIASLLLPDETSLAQKIFSIRLQNGSATTAILLDGFDEIQTPQQEKVIALLKKLRSTQVKQLVITTRPHTSVQAQLEEALSVFAHDLIPFTNEEARCYILNEWLKTVDQTAILAEKREKINAYIKALIVKLQDALQDKKGEWIGVPLQVNLLATAFLPSFTQYCADENTNWSPPATFTIGEFYQQVITAKYAILIEEKLKHSHVDEFEEIKATLTERLDTHHARLAFETLFPGLSPVELPPLAPHARALLQRTGLVSFNEEKPKFIHRTFAEYFAAAFFLKQLQRSPDHPKYQQYRSLLLTHIFKDRYTIVRQFIEALVSIGENLVLKHTWQKILSCNLSPPSSAERLRLFRISKEDDEDTSSSISLEEAKKNAWIHSGAYVNYVKGATYTEVYCKLILQVVDSEILKASLYDLYKLIFQTAIAKVQWTAQYYLEDILLWYVKVCVKAKSSIDINLIYKGGYEGKYPKAGVWYLNSGTWATLQAIAKHREGINDPNFFRYLDEFISNICTERKIGGVSLDIEKLRAFLLLKSIWTDLSATIHVPDSLTFLIHDLTIRLYGSFTLQSLERVGISLVHKFAWLSPEMVKEFIRPMHENHGIEWKRGYVRNIWRNLPSLLHQVTTIEKNNIDKVALLDMCVHFLEFLYKEKIDAPLTHTECEHLLTLIERTVVNVSLSTCVNLLYLLGASGLQLTDIEGILMVQDTTGKLNRELQFKERHQAICSLLAFKIAHPEDIKAFEEECNKFMHP